MSESKNSKLFQTGRPLLPSIARPTGFSSDDYSSEEEDGFEMFSGAAPTQTKGVSQVDSSVYPNTSHSFLQHQRPNTLESTVTTPSKDNNVVTKTNIKTNVKPGTAATPSTSTVKRKITLPKMLIPSINIMKAATHLNALKSTYLKNSNDEFKKVMHKILVESVNPFALALYLSTHSHDFLMLKAKSLAFSIINEFKNFLVLGSNLEKMEKKHLSLTLQKIAFEMFTLQKNAALLKMAFNVFRMDLIRDSLIPKIKDMCTSQRYKDACTCASALELHPHFTIHEFVIPLIFQSRESIAEDFLMGSKDKQRDLLEFLDNLVGNRNITNIIQEYISDRDIPDVKLEKLNSKPLYKLLKRLSSKFNADPTSCPRLGRKQRFGSLKHVVTRKYSEKNDMSAESFNEIVEGIVGDDVELQDEAIYLMRMHDDYKGAAGFAIRLAVPLAKIPQDVLIVMHKMCPNIVPNPKSLQQPTFDLSKENWESDDGEDTQTHQQGRKSPEKTNIRPIVSQKSAAFTPTASTSHQQKICAEIPKQKLQQPHQKKKCYVMPLSGKDIHMCSTADQILEFIEKLRLVQRQEGPQKCIMVGFDAEWKPVFPMYDGAALLQIALAEDVYLIDTFSLRAKYEDGNEPPKNDPTGTDIWKLLLDELFCNAHVIKVAYDIMNDLKMLSCTAPAWRNMKCELKACVDLHTLQKDIASVNPAFFPYFSAETNSGETGLSELVRLVLGCPLNKEDQFSDWEQRPLRPSQLTYAAADAYCLLDIFKEIVRLAYEKMDLGVNIDDFVQKQLQTVRTDKKSGKSKSSRASKRASVLKCTKEALETCSGPSTSKLETHADGRKHMKTDNPPPQNAREMKIVCDNMLQGLGHKLRACGIDTVILHSMESHDVAVHHALTEDRLLLTKGTAYDQVAGCVRHGQAYRVVTDAVIEQLREVIVHFKVGITESDLFTHCQRCNGTVFIQVKSGQMRQMLRSMNVNLRRRFTDKKKILADSPALQEGRITSSVTPTNKNWQILSQSAIHVGEDRVMRTESDACVDVNKIPLAFLDLIDNFYVCNLCGKCYWESNQLEKEI